jgi:predicted MFS family arabinose efflux permease
MIGLALFAPIRALFTSARGASAALVASASAVALLFAATPFVIPEVAERFEVSLGASGLISAAQVLGFAITTFVAGRRLQASRRYLLGAAIAAVALNLASAVWEVFPVLVLLRSGAGSAAGFLTWIAWTDAMHSRSSMRDIAGIGPLTVFVGAPLLAWIASQGGDRAVYLFLATTTVPAALLPFRVRATGRHERRRMSPSRSNVVLLIALGSLTMGGSALFVFIAAFGAREVGLAAVAVSLGFSLNALTGLVGARWRSRPTSAWPWLLSIGAAVVGLIAFHEPVVFYVGLALWGFGFWMAVPTVLTDLADWSLAPDERVGDAQSIMALGRAIGPAVGGALIGSAGFSRVGVFTGVMLGLATILVAMVEWYRRRHPERRPGAVR